MVVADTFVKPLYLVGDSHTVALGGLLLRERQSGAPLAIAETIFVPRLHAYETMVDGVIYPGLVAGLAGAGLLTNEPSPEAPELGIEHHGQVLRAHSRALTRDALVSAGAGDAREVIRSVPLDAEVELPFEADLSTLPRDGVVAVVPTGDVTDVILRHFQPFYGALQKLRDVGLKRLSLLGLPPPTPDDAGFFEKHEIRSRALVRTQVHLLINATSREFCRREGFGFVDPWNEVTERNVVKDGWLTDGVHLGPHGAVATLLRFYEIATKAAVAT